MPKPCYTKPTPTKRTPHANPIYQHHIALYSYASYDCIHQKH
ncbi:hypothetical protein [Moraxella lacunata]